MITCHECNHDFKRLNVFHLRTHGLDEKTYLVKYPGASIFSKETLQKISVGTKVGMNQPEARRKLLEHAAHRDNTRQAENFKSNLPETKKKMYTRERNEKVSAGKKSWWHAGRVGKTVEHLFGEEVGKRIRKTKSERMSGEKNPAYGKMYEKIGRKVGRYKGKLFRSVYEYYYYKHLELQGIDLTKVEYEPFSISYKIRGKSRNYHPDFLVHPLKLLVEVKSQYALQKKRGSRILAAKHAAAVAYCSLNDLTFIVLTEKDFPIGSYPAAYADSNVEWIRR